MPDWMEPSARVSERWSSGGAARVDLRRATRDTEDPMTEDRMALVELLQKSGEADFLRAVAESVLQILMEADVEGLIGAGRHERTGDRLNYRNGYRDRSGYPARSVEPAHPQAAPGLLLPALPRAAQDRREGACDGHSRSLDRRRVDPPCR